MEKLPEHINSISLASMWKKSDGRRRSTNIRITYNIYAEGIRTCQIVDLEARPNSLEMIKFDYFRPREIDRYGIIRPSASTDIIDKNSSFVNGFKVVKTSTGEYAYVRESDNILMPYRYDIATDFNEHGFAMVGKNGFVTWIDKDFRYLNRKGEMVKEETDNSFYSWEGVDDFSKGEIPLSRVFVREHGNSTFGKMAYFTTDGTLKKFYKYDGEEIDRSNAITDFDGICSNRTLFDKKNYISCSERLLFAKGYYIEYKDIVKIPGVYDLVSSNVEHLLNEKDGKGFRLEKKQ